MSKDKGYGVKGMYSCQPKEAYAKRVDSSYGPSKNADQIKANKLLKSAHTQNESLRGRGVM